MAHSSQFSSSSSSSSPPPLPTEISSGEKPVFLRVQRKASQSCFDAIWLEIREKPLEQALKNLSKLSISDSAEKGSEAVERQPLKQTFADFGKLSLSESTSTGLETDKRPLKRSFMDFDKLSISESTSKRQGTDDRRFKRSYLSIGDLIIPNPMEQEMKAKMVFMRHVITASSFDSTIDILPSFMPDVSSASVLRTKIEERRLIIDANEDIAVDPSSNHQLREGWKECDHSFVPKDDIGIACCICGKVERGIETIVDFYYHEDQAGLMFGRKVEKVRRRKISCLRRKHCVRGFRDAAFVCPTLANNARFEQIRRRQKGMKEDIYDELLRETCHLYDIIRVDKMETRNVVEEQMDISSGDKELLRGFLSLLGEYMPDAAANIESDLLASSNHASGNEYVYDLYVVKDNSNVTIGDIVNQHPVVQVDDEELYTDPTSSSNDLATQ